MIKIKRALTLSLAITTLLATAVFANPNVDINEGENQGNDYRSEEKMKKKGPELSDELREKVIEMKEAGATREEIHTFLVSEGVEFPEKPDGEKPEGRKGPELSDELREKVIEMKEAGASKEEIHTF